MQVTVLGATGGIGRATVTALAERGHAVTAASRSAADAAWPTGVRGTATDLSDAAAARAACADADVVVMAAGVPYSRWAEELEDLVDGALNAAGDAGARLVYVDNLYAYAPLGAPISTDTPEFARTRKGRLRARLATRVRAANESGWLATSIARLSDYYGPGASNALVHSVAVDRVLAGKPPRAYLATQVPHAFHYLPDVGRALATLVEQPAADGRTWILPAAPAITQAELYGHLAVAGGLEPKVGRITPFMLRMAGWGNPDLKEARELASQFTRPWELDTSAFTETFGPQPVTPHAQAARDTITWYRAQAQPATAD